MKPINILVLALVVLSLSACSINIGGSSARDMRNETHSSWQEREQRNRDYIARMQQGRSVNHILEALGTPDFDEWEVRGDEQYRVLYYRTQRVKADGMTTRDECTPIIFQDGKVVKWGHSSLRQL